MVFKPGQSGNPSGRRRQPPEVREAIRTNGELAVRRMQDIMEDDTAWGREGWIPPKDQITLLEKAQDRAWGKAENLSISHSHSHSGSIEHKKTEQPSRPSLKAVKLPEKGAVIEGKAVEVK